MLCKKLLLRKLNKQKENGLNQYNETVTLVRGIKTQKKDRTVTKIY